MNTYKKLLIAVAGIHLSIFSNEAFSQSCFEDAVSAIQNVDSRGEFMSVQCTPKGEYPMRYETSCSAGGISDYLFAEVLLTDANDQLTCRVTVDGSGGDCPAVSTTEYYYETRKEYNDNKKLIRNLCKDLPWTLARISISGDDGYELYVNGQYIGEDHSWFVAETWNAYLSEGKNVIAIKGLNNANGTHPGAVISDVSIQSNRIVTDSSWMMSTDYVDGWNEIEGSLINAGPSIEYGSIFHPTWWYREYYGSFLLDESQFPLDSTAMWIWSEGLQTDPVVYFRKEIYVE